MQISKVLIKVLTISVTVKLTDSCEFARKFEPRSGKPDIVQ